MHNRLPWPHSKEDMQWFIRHTRGKAVIMGSTTWESLPKKPLPGRTNIVITRSDNQYSDHTITSTDDSTLIEKLNEFIGDQDAVVIGGASIYQLLWPHITTLYWSKFNSEYECDTYLEIPNMMGSDSRIWVLESEITTDEINFETWKIE